MPVNATHKEYNKMLPKWELVRAIVDNSASHLIRNVDPNDPARTKQYREDAILTNFTRLTQNGLVGLVYRKPSLIDLPDALEYLLDDATGTDFGLEQFSQQVLGEVLKTGRVGLLADMPKVSDDDKSEVVSKIKSYPAESIINWKFDTIGSDVKLTKVILIESVDKLDPLDEFEWHSELQYRVLRLVGGVYSQELYDCDYMPVAGSYIEPVDYNGKTFDTIPFVFVGSENNDAICDPVPLYDLAALNLGHYRNSADYEESIFICGQPTIFLSIEGSQEEFKLLYPNGIKMGSRGGFNLGPNGTAQLIQANPNQLAAQAMSDKLEQAAAIGARLIAQSGGRETAEAARIRYGAQNSALYTITHNVADAFEEILEYIARFMLESWAEEEIVFQLNDQYYEDTADPLLIAQEILLMQNGVISKDDVRNNLRDVGVISEQRSNEDIEKDVDLTDPMIGAPIVPNRRVNKTSSVADASNQDSGE